MARTKSTFGKKTDSLISGFNALKRQRDQKKSAEEAVGNKEGVWRTVRGRHVFIEEGKTLEQALGHKPGVENQKKVENLEDELSREAFRKKVGSNNYSESYYQQYAKENPEKFYRTEFRKRVGSANYSEAYYQQHLKELKRGNRKK